MGTKKDDLPKVFPFVTPDPPPHAMPEPPPTFKSNSKISQRGLLSATTLLLSLGSLTIALLGGAKLILDIFDEGLFSHPDQVSSKAIVLSLAYLFGWLAALVCVRVYNNLILPIIIQIYTWGCLIAVDVLYLKIIQKLYAQMYDSAHFVAYFLIIAAGLAALVGLHLIIEGHDLRLYAIPLLAMCMVELAFIVFRYIFTIDAKPEYLWADLFFFSSMLTFSILMLAHLGIMMPLRRRLTRFFDKNSLVIRPES